MPLLNNFKMNDFNPPCVYLIRAFHEVAGRDPNMTEAIAVWDKFFKSMDLDEKLEDPFIGDDLIKVRGLLHGSLYDDLKKYVKEVASLGLEEDQDYKYECTCDADIVCGKCSMERYYTFSGKEIEVYFGVIETK